MFFTSIQSILPLQISGKEKLSILKIMDLKKLKDLTCMDEIY